MTTFFTVLLWILGAGFLLCLLGIAYNFGAFVANAENEEMLNDWNNAQLQKMATNELAEILYYLETNLDELDLNPEEREMLLYYIDDFHDLIIEDCIRFGKCEITYE